MAGTDWNLPTLNTARSMELSREFAKQLEGFEFSEKLNNKIISTRLKSKNVDVIVRLFFEDVFGESCQQRMFALLDELFQAQNGNAVGSQVEQKAQNTGPSPEVREFLLQYSQWNRQEIRSASAEAQAMVTRTIRAFELYNYFYCLREKAAGSGGQEIRDFLASQGFTCKVGVGIDTCILKYLSRELGLRLGQLSNLLQSKQGIFHLVQEFGRGSSNS